MAAGCAALSFLAVSDHRSRARDKNLATLNKGTTNQGHDNRPTRHRGAALIFPPTPTELVR